ncbi:MAG: alpha/beta hydrolase [Streptomycetaceae bacterium]|nr:alpha/beta hydrolase [Streptomycetaceae bacterium]
MTIARPDLDPELLRLLADMPLGSALDRETLPEMRQFAAVPAETVLAGRAVDRREVTATRPEGTPLHMTVLSPDGPRPMDAPCVYWIHGGGMVMGDRFSQIDIPLDWLDRFGAVVVTVEYRLAPEFGGTALVDDCYRGLGWIAEHATELGVDPRRIVVAGASAGGGLAAGTTVMAHDLSGPSIAAQVLVCPMLDHRNTTVSAAQFTGVPAVWTAETNAFGWSCVLAGLDVDDVPAYVSPALAEDLSGLPPTYIDAGSSEVFRDEGVAHATRIWAAGGDAELHIWQGGCHGFDALFPQAQVSVAARHARSAWLDRILSHATAPTRT